MKKHDEQVKQAPIRKRIYHDLVYLWKARSVPISLEDIHRETGYRKKVEIWNTLQFLRSRGYVKKLEGNKAGWIPAKLPDQGICWIHGSPLLLSSGEPFCATCKSREKRGI